MLAHAMEADGRMIWERWAIRERERIIHCPRRA